MGALLIRPSHLVTTQVVYHNCIIDNIHRNKSSQSLLVQLCIITNIIIQNVFLNINCAFFLVLVGSGIFVCYFTFQQYLRSYKYKNSEYTNSKHDLQLTFPQIGYMLIISLIHGKKGGNHRLAKAVLDHENTNSQYDIQLRRRLIFLQVDYKLITFRP